MGNVEYTAPEILRDRFDTLFIVCPLCDSQVEVELPPYKDLESIPYEEYNESEFIRLEEEEEDDALPEA